MQRIYNMNILGIENKITPYDWNTTYWHKHRRRYLRFCLLVFVNWHSVALTF